jgi:hypothetical protein
MTEILKDYVKKSHRKWIAIGLTCILCWFFAYLGMNVFRDYALGLFVWLPLVLGTTSTLLYGYKHESRKRKLFSVSFTTLFVFCLGLLAFAWEGIICLAMAFPIGLLFTYIGHWIGHQVLNTNSGNGRGISAILFLSVPLFMSFENASEDKEQLRSVTTYIEINASEEEVWENVISFPQLNEPTEFIFKTGIAYPTNATIIGQGVGATRHCNFSTGSFIEPITVWNEPKLLKFSVSQQPVPMKEISFYDIEPNHLHGYWVSKEGQFKLTKLSNGNVLLEGTTWYFNKIKPGFYWTIWSDYIVHKIHERVLDHIKKQAEAKS